MNDDKFPQPQPPPNKKRVMSFKAVIVLTKNDGMNVTLADLDETLSKSGLAYAMPAGDAPVVISFSMRGIVDDVHDTGPVAEPESDVEGG